MNRHHLLTLASQCIYSDGYALELAHRLTTPAAVQDAMSDCSKRAARLGVHAELCFRSFIGFGLLFAAAVLLMAHGVMSNETAADPAWCAGIIAASLAGMLGAAVFGIQTAARRDHSKEELKLVTPVVNSSACQSALQYIEAGEPEVVAWRDLVVAQREVLCAFDVFIMRDIHYALLAARDAARIQSAQEAACRALYGIATPAPVGA